MKPLGYEVQLQRTESDQAGDWYTVRVYLGKELLGCELAQGEYHAQTVGRRIVDNIRKASIQVTQCEAV